MGCILGLVCDDCQATYSDLEPVNACPKCGGFLDAVYDYEAIRSRLELRDVQRRGRSIWRWRELLPLKDERHMVSLGEGGTPLHRCQKIGAKLGLPEVYVKDDTIGPTASLKDRSFSIAVSKAVEMGIKQALTYTSGNAGGSFAAYAAKAGMQALILVNEWTTDEKLAMILVYGHQVIKVRFQTFAEVTELLRRVNTELNLYQFTNFINPFRHEGMKTYAYEICEALNWSVPDWVIHPVGTGGGLFGDWKGFNELRRLGLIASLPKMVGVQPEATPAIVIAYREGRQVAAPAGDNRKTIAQSIAADAPLGGGKRALRAIYESGGSAEAVSDEEMLEAIAWLGQEGIFAEPAAASSVAALKKMVERGDVQREERVVCVVTASGLKQPEASLSMFSPPPVINCDLDQFMTMARRVWGEIGPTR
ncbi:MAG: threonine synthase [Chloroflexi bacterium]|nr:threonine synthase [Chloroflexota bacterium]